MCGLGKQHSNKVGWSSFIHIFDESSFYIIILCFFKSLWLNSLWIQQLLNPLVYKIHAYKMVMCTADMSPWTGKGMCSTMTWENFRGVGLEFYVKIACDWYFLSQEEKCSWWRQYVHVIKVQCRGHKSNSSIWLE